ncbi:MAG: glycosyltransferase family 4 protein [Pirellulales bacterium]
MAMPSADLRLGVLSGVVATRDAQGRVVCNHSIGRVLDRIRELVPRTRLCVPVLSERQPGMNHVVNIPPEDVVELPPLVSVIRSQVYSFQTRRILRRFAKSVDVLLLRVPFQIDRALLGLSTPKLVNVVGNPYEVIAASSDYRGVMKLLALRFAAHSNATIRRMIAEPMTRAATHGRQMWDLLGCRHGRVVVSSCIYEREMRGRENLALGDPPKILFVGYLRPEKGIDYLLDAFETLRKSRPLKLTLVGGSDRVTNAEARVRQRIAGSPFRSDIAVTGMLDFGEPLFELYRSHDLFVMPSLSEGTPRTLVEARAFGCPVVATRAGGIPSSVEHEKNGLLVEPRDAPALAAAIERVLTDETLRTKLVIEGMAAARACSLERFVEELLEEIAILERDRRGRRVPEGAYS